MARVHRESRNPMTDPSASSPAATPAQNRAAVRHLMLFFALVYVVEGVGQISGLIAQPLSFYLKAGPWLERSASHRLSWRFSIFPG